MDEASSVMVYPYDGIISFDDEGVDAVDGLKVVELR